MALSDKEQYTQLPYPPYNPESEDSRLLVPTMSRLDQVGSLCFNGELDVSEGIRVLDAGGGTGNITISLAEQLRDTPSEVVYVDISPASMALAQEGARRRGLDNITWRQGSLLDLPNDPSVGKFDYIVSSGVLHILDSPLAGLTALREVMKDNGALGVFVYATYGREERSRFRRVLQDGLVANATSAREELAIARRFLDEQTDEWRAAHPDMLREASTDSGLYDMLLREDRTYTVPEVYEWAADAGLEVAGFVTPNVGYALGYEPERYFKDPVLQGLAQALPREKREALAEAVAGTMKKHCFLLTATPDCAADINNPEMVPALSISFGNTAYQALKSKVTGDPNAPISLFGTENAFNADVVPGPYAAEFFAYCAANRDGANTTVAEIISQIARNNMIRPAQVQAEISRLYPTLRDVDWLTLRHNSVPGFKTAGNIQREHLDRQQKHSEDTLVLDGLAETIAPALGVAVENYTYKW